LAGSPKSKTRALGGMMDFQSAAGPGVAAIAAATVKLKYNHAFICHLHINAFSVLTCAVE
jgi:hypothetical protein